MRRHAGHPWPKTTWFWMRKDKSGKRLKRGPARGSRLLQRTATRDTRGTVGRDQNKPVAAVFATERPCRIGADVAPEQGFGRAHASLSGVAHQFRERRAPTRPILNFDGIAIFVPTAPPPRELFISNLRAQNDADQDRRYHCPRQGAAYITAGVAAGRAPSSIALTRRSAVGTLHIVLPYREVEYGHPILGEERGDATRIIL